MSGSGGHRSRWSGVRGWPAGVRTWRNRPAMPADHLTDRDGITRPRVIVSVTATADGRVTLSRGSGCRMTDRASGGRPRGRRMPVTCWRAGRPPSSSVIIRPRSWRQRHVRRRRRRPVDLPGTSGAAEVLRTDFLPFWRRRWRRSGCSSERSAWYRRPAAGSTAPCCGPALSMSSTTVPALTGGLGTIWAHYGVVARRSGQ
jgi:hypothetical protein